MDPQTALTEKLRRHPELTYSEASSSVRIEASSPTGFAVELRSGHNNWTVFLGDAGFHEAFTSAADVLNFIAWCYSGAARVREVWRGNLPEKAILESQENGEWQSISETRFIFVPFWRKRREVVLTNPNLLTD